MSKAYEMISESINELIKDLKETDGKNLKRELVITADESKKSEKIYDRRPEEHYFEQRITF